VITGPFDPGSAEGAILNAAWRAYVRQAATLPGWEGAVEADPAEFVCGERRRMEIRFRVPAPMAGSGFVLLDLPKGWGGWRLERDTEYLSKAGGVRATLDGTECTPVRVISRGSRLAIILVQFPRPASSESILRVLLPPLLPCDRPGRHTFHFIAGDAEGTPTHMAAPHVSVSPGIPVGWDLTAPSTAEPGVSFSILLRPHTGPSSSYATAPPTSKMTGQPVVTAEGVQGLPTSAMPETGPGGTLRMDGLALAADHGRIRLADAAAGSMSRSHPLISTTLTGGLHIFFGDLHVHTEESDGIGSPEEAYQWARDGAGLDFVALNDHVEDRLRYSRSGWEEREWRSMFDRADAFDEPGRFTTIPGVELAGSINLYFRDRGVRYVPLRALEQKPAHVLGYLEEISRDERVLFGYHKLAEIEEHYLQGPPPDLVEIIQHKRTPELGLDRLLGICRLPPAFTGGTDSHQGLAGSPPMGFSREESQYGLTAVLANEKTRGAIFSALALGRTFVTSGQRSLLLVRLNGELPGGSVVIPSKSRAVVSVLIRACTSVQSVELILDGDTVWRDGPMSDTIDRAIDLSDILDVRLPPEGGFLHVRMREADGKQAWSSPIRVNRPRK